MRTHLIGVCVVIGLTGGAAAQEGPGDWRELHRERDSMSARVLQGSQSPLVLDCADQSFVDASMEDRGCHPRYAGAAFGTGSWVRLKVTPASARVYLNGTYVGTADRFAAPFRGLPVGQGPQRIDLRAAGHKNTSFWLMQGVDRAADVTRELERKP